MSDHAVRAVLLLGVLLGLGIGCSAGIGLTILTEPPAPSPQPRETPWTWDAPDSNARCYFLEDQPIGCYQKGTAP